MTISIDLKTHVYAYKNNNQRKDAMKFRMEGHIGKGNGRALKKRLDGAR